MVVKKRKKIRRLRGRRTMGWGLVHRGKGQKGGVGRAGRGKRSKAKKPSFWKEPLGRMGFVKHGFVRKERVINLKTVSQNLENWEKQGLVKRSKEALEINLGALGYSKLLGSGKAKLPLIIHVPEASEEAIKKVESSKGKVLTR